VDAVLDALERISDDVESLDPDDRTMFVLAVCEIATNIAKHARPRPGSVVSVEALLHIDAHALAATFVDNAKPADIALDAVALPEEGKESGRGLAIVRAATDELSHEPADGNIWRLRRLRGRGRG